MSRIVDAMILLKKSHANMAPSKAHRWLVCPGSMHVSTDDPETEWAAEGTRKHAVLKLVLDDKPPIAGDTIDTEAGPYKVPLEVIEQCYEVRDFILQLKSTNTGWSVETETRVEVGAHAWGLPVGECAGTVDAAAYSDTELLVLDAKFGFIRVEARGNPQLSLYAIGLLAEIPFPIKHVTLCIAQPDYSGVMEFREHRTTPDALAAWALDQLSVVEEIKSGSRRLQADDHACRYCPARVQCPARLQAMEQFQHEEWLASAPLEELLPLLPRVRQICKDIEQRAMAELNQGHPVRGWKLVAAESKRKWPASEKTGEPDADAVERFYRERVKAPLDFYEKKLKSPAQLQKDIRLAVNGGPGRGSMSVKEAEKLVNLVAIKPAGAPKLVSVTDERPALEAAAWTAADLLEAQLEASTFEDNNG